MDNTCFLRGLSGGACTSFDPSDRALYIPNREGGGQVVEKYELNASHEYEYVCQFTGYGGLAGSACEGEPARSPTTHFAEPSGVAVDGEGNVFISDFGSEAVYEFNAKGEEVQGPIKDPFGSPAYLGVDGSGDLFVAGQFASEAVEFKPNHSGGFEPGVEVASGVYGLAVEPVHDRLYVDFGSHVSEYDVGSGAPVLVSEFGEGVISVFSIGVGVNSANGDIYVSDLGGVMHIFSGPLAIPDTKTGGVAGLGVGVARLEGEVDPLATTLTTCEFQYGTEASGSQAPYTSSVPCSTTPGGNGFTAVAGRAEGLEPNTQYHYRLVTGNENGKTYGEDATFRSFEAPPSVNDKPAFASDISQLAATLNGVIDPNKIPTSYHFVYGTTSAYGSVSPNPDQYIPINYIDNTVSQPVVGLAPGTTYHFALVATSPGGTTVGPDETFVTLPVPLPAVSTGGASGASVDAATLSGSIDPQGWETGYYFEYGPSIAYGSRWPGIPIALGALTASQPIVTLLENLQPGTLYHYRLVATNAGGTGYGADQTFQTQEYPASIIQETPLLKTPIGINPETKSSSKAPVKHKARKRRKAGRKGKRRKKG